MQKLNDIKLFNLIKKFEEYNKEKNFRSRMSMSSVLGLDKETSYCEYLNSKVSPYFCIDCNIKCLEKQKRTGD